MSERSKFVDSPTLANRGHHPPGGRAEQLGHRTGACALRTRAMSAAPGLAPMNGPDTATSVTWPPLLINLQSTRQPATAHSKALASWAGDRAAVGQIFRVQPTSCRMSRGCLIWLRRRGIPLLLATELITTVCYWNIDPATFTLHVCLIKSSFNVLLIWWLTFMNI